MPCEQCKDENYKWGKTGSCKYATKEECEEANKDYYEDMKETKIVELVIADDSQELAIDAISLVASPAIEQDFVYFNKAKNNLTFAKVDEEKRMLVSPALIPNKQIFRYDPNTDSEYYVYFSPETVRKASELYLRHNNHHKATYEHQDRVSGVLTVESWIIEDPKTDKSTLYGYNLPKGTWMVKMKIDNNDLWSKVKDGELRGLSIEGYFTNKFETMNEKKPTDHEILTALNELIKEGKLKDLSLGKKLSLAKKVELQDINTLDKLTSQAYDIYDAFPEKNEIEIAFDRVDDEQSDIDFSNEKLKEFQELAKEYEDDLKFNKEELKALQSTIKDDTQEFKAANKSVKEWTGEVKAATKKRNQAQKAANALAKKATGQITKAKQIAKNLDKAMTDFEKAAKALGVNVSSKLSEYDNALSDIKYVANFKIPKIK
jgi:O6-methylguanine-DNA--protein-cysteine methyltransferase